jgi:hypothetical protein
MNISTQSQCVKVHHAYRDRIFVPWCAIAGYTPGSLKKGCIITLSDGVDAKIRTMQELHIASSEGIMLAQELYGINVMKFIREWYNRIPELSSMWFVDLQLRKLIQIDHADTEGIPE